MLLCRRARQPQDACEACRKTARAWREAGRHRTHRRADRPRHRRREPGRDRRRGVGASGARFPLARHVGRAQAERRSGMKFGPVRVEDAEGALLAHATTAGEKRFRKAHRLTAEDIAFLKSAGIRRGRRGRSVRRRSRRGCRSGTYCRRDALPRHRDEAGRHRPRESACVGSGRLHRRQGSGRSPERDRSGDHAGDGRRVQAGRKKRHGRDGEDHSLRRRPRLGRQGRLASRGIGNLRGSSVQADDDRLCPDHASRAEGQRACQDHPCDGEPPGSVGQHHRARTAYAA